MLTSLHRAVRILRKDPVFTAVAIGSLAIGIGATSAMFSFADSMLLRPLPVRQPDRVVAINTATSAPFGSNTGISYPDYADLRDRNRSFDGLVAASYAKFGFSPNPGTLPRMKFGLYVSGNFFKVLGVEPVLGRGFRPDEDQTEARDPVVVLGHDFWIGQFDGNPSVIGSRIRLNGIEFSVIGVAPEQFTGIDVFMRPTLFVPLAMAPRLDERNNLHDRDLGWLFVKGWLKPGVGADQAQADIGALSAGLQKLHRETSRAQSLQVETELQLRAAQNPVVINMVTMLGALGLCVLLVACANVAGLLLSRSRVRSREIAVRLAIGASRGALVRQLLLENLMVAVAGGLGGVLVADAFADLWRRVPIPYDLPIVFAIGVDRRALLFTMAVSLVSTLLFGLAPALQATRPDLMRTLRAADADSGGKRRLLGRHTMVAGQVALSMILLAISAVLVQGFHDELAQGPGFRTDRLFLTSFDTQLIHYSDEQTRRFYNDLLERTRAAPGVRSAALASFAPLTGTDHAGIVPEGYQFPRGEPAIPTAGAYVSEGYFGTLDIRIERGRGFLESDRMDAPLVAVVNEHMARHYWPNGDAFGKRFHVGTATGRLVEIVGIVGRSKYLWIAERPSDFFYLPFRQDVHSALTLLVESEAQDAATIAPALREVVRSLDPDMPVFEVRTMHDFYRQRAVKTPDILVQVVAGLGLMGLILALVGLYGLVAYSVSRRTREIGIRMAIGADRGKVVRMVLRQGLRLGVAGVAIGLIVGFFACRAVTSSDSFASFDRFNPLILVAIALPLLAITGLAAWLPARRASLIDPLRALRDE